MKLRPMSGLAALVVASALVLSGCSTDADKNESNPNASSSTDASLTTTTPEDLKLLEGIEFQSKAENKAPTDVKVAGDLNKLSGASVRVVSEGTGDEIPLNSIAEVHMISVDPSGKQIASTYEEGAPQVIPISAATIPQLVTALQGQKVGVRAVFAAPGVATEEGADQPDPTIFLMEVVGVRKAEVVENSDALPQVTRDDKGVPSIEIPKDFKATKNIQVVQLEKGDGEFISPADTIKANYTGWNLKGNQFDTSFDKEAVEFPLSNVIQGWTYGLSGQQVGSKVLLIIPADLGYGPSSKDDADDAATGDLLFVVDIVSKS